MIPERPPYWQIQGVWLFYLAALVAVSVFVLGLVTHFRAWSRAGGRPSLFFSKSGVVNLVGDGLVGRRIFRGDLAAGLMHLSILWGFIGLFIGTTLVALDEYLYHFLTGNVYLVFSAALEVAGLLLLSGLVWALVRRYIQCKPRLERRWDGLLILLWLMAIALTGYLVEGLRIAHQSPEWAAWSFVGLGSGALFSGWTNIPAIYPYFWWLHGLLSLGLIAAIPYTRLFHVLAAPTNIYLREMVVPEYGTHPVVLDAAAKNGEVPGAAATSGAISDTPAAKGGVADAAAGKGEGSDAAGFLFRDLVAFEACTQCGRCVEACPSAGAGEPFAPRSFILSHKAQYDGRLHLFGRSREEDGEVFFDEDRVWHCTTCGACTEVCPVYVPIPSAMRQVRSRILEEGTRVSPHLSKALEKLFRYNNPWEGSKRKRDKWAKGFDVPTLSTATEQGTLCYFVGCTTALDTRTQLLAQAFVQILNHAGVAFGTLGKDEPCCGDIARRVGEDGLFEEQRGSCMALFDELEVRDIVTSSPHCFHTFRNEYPHSRPLSGESTRDIRVRHYTEILLECIQKGTLTFEQPLPLKVTFHDPCYLGRHNRIIDAPRKVIDAIPGVTRVEMAHFGFNSLCCGGGGGRMWQQDLDAEQKMSEIRIREAVEIGAEVLVTACPLCLIMLEDARKTACADAGLRVLDLNELVLQAQGMGAD